jgi:hypothetical protein
VWGHSGHCYNWRMRSRNLFRLIPLVCVLTRVATGQIQVHFGVEAGVPLTDTLSSSSQSSNSVIPMGSTSGTSSFFDRYNSETKRLLIGPAFRVEMQSGLGIEIDALYQRIDYDHATSSVLSGVGAPNTRSFEQTSANRWQFPLLIQYTRRLSKPNMRVFVEAGPSISRIAGSRSTISTTTISSSGSSSKSSITGQGGTLAGVVAGGGVDIPLLRAHLRPEFRYSHWFSQNATPLTGIVTPGAALNWNGQVVSLFSSVIAVPSFRTTQNEASFLLGLTF